MTTQGKLLAACALVLATLFVSTRHGAFDPEEESLTMATENGNPVEAILRVGEEVSATLVAAGTTGKSGIERLLKHSHRPATRND